VKKKHIKYMVFVLFLTVALYGISHYFFRQELNTIKNDFLFEDQTEYMHIDRNSDIGVMLDRAINYGDSPTVEDLIESGKISVNTKFNNLSLFCGAIQLGNLERIKFLVENGAYIETRDADGRTPLMQAIIFRQVPISQYLVNRGAEINAIDNNGQTPLIWAVRKRLSNVVELLLDKGSAINHTDENGWSALMWAYYIGDIYPYSDEKIGSIDILLESGADENITDNSGQDIGDIKDQGRWEGTMGPRPGRGR